MIPAHEALERLREGNRRFASGRRSHDPHLSLARRAEMAQAQGIDFVSFFWSGFYYAYLEADPALLEASALERYQELNRLQYANLLAGTLTDTGNDFQEFLAAR